MKPHCARPCGVASPTPAGKLSLCCKPSTGQPLPTSYGNPCRVAVDALAKAKPVDSQPTYSQQFTPTQNGLSKAKSWPATCITTGVRIAASSTTSSTAAMPTPAPATPSAGTFQAALASSTDRANADNGSFGVESKAHSGASTAARQASKPENAQPLANGSSTVAPTVPPVDEKATSANDSLAGQEGDARSGDGSSNATAEAPGFHLDVTSSDSASPMPAAPAKASTSDPAAPPQQQPAIVASSDKAVGEAVASVASAALEAAATLDAAAQAGAGVNAQSAAGTFNFQMPSSSASILSNKADSTQSSGKLAQKTTMDAVGPKNSDATATSDTPRATGAGMAVDASSHGAQSNGQPAQHSQADSSQPQVTMPKAVDSASAQAQPIPAPAVSPEAATATGSLLHGSHRQLESSDTSSSALDEDEVAASGGINASRIVQTMSETEMRVGLHSSEFGAISIRTSVSQQQMLAQISLDHGDLSRAISAHVASVQTKLGNDSGLDTLIQVNHQAASTFGQSGSRQKEQSAFAPSAPLQSVAVPVDPDVGISPAVLAGTNGSYRLDIRA